jgi:hypothetical protein
MVKELGPYVEYLRDKRDVGYGTCSGPLVIREFILVVCEFDFEEYRGKVFIRHALPNHRF